VHPGTGGLGAYSRSVAADGVCHTDRLALVPVGGAVGSGMVATSTSTDRARATPGKGDAAQDNKPGLSAGCYNSP
jgi:hypothetical protein